MSEYIPTYEINSFSDSGYDVSQSSNGEYFNNPLIDPDTGKIIDWNPGSGGNSSISRDARGEVIAAWQTANATIEAAVIESLAAAYAAETEAKAAVEASLISAEAQMYDADKNFEAVEKQCETDYQIALMEREVEMQKLVVEQESIEKVDSVNAQANLQSAQALTIEANAEQTEADAKKLDAQGYSYAPSAW